MILVLFIGSKNPSAAVVNVDSMGLVVASVRLGNRFDLTRPAGLMSCLGKASSSAKSTESQWQ